MDARPVVGGDECMNKITITCMIGLMLASSFATTTVELLWFVFMTTMYSFSVLADSRMGEIRRGEG